MTGPRNWPGRSSAEQWRFTTLWQKYKVGRDCMNETLKNTIEKIIFAKYESEKENFQHEKMPQNGSNHLNY